MTDASANKETKYRFAAFAGVLLIVSGLVVTLFEEARGAEINFETNTALGAGRTISVLVEIPEGQQLPISSVTAVVESNPNGRTAKVQGDNYQIKAISQCDQPIVGCSSLSAMDQTELIGTAVTAIYAPTFLRNAESGTGYTTITDASGYSKECSQTANGYCFMTHGGGYGYKAPDNGLPAAGYGYGGIFDTGYGYTETSGYGYGYDTGTLYLRYSVTIDTTGLDSTNGFFLTFLVDTGSSTMGTLSSPATPFTFGSGGGGGGGAATGGSTSVVKLTATKVAAPEGALAKYSVKVTATKGQTVEISTGDPRLPKITLKMDGDATDVTFDVTVWPASTPPPNTGAPPNGVTAAYYIDVDFTGAISEATFDVEIDEADVPDAAKAALIHFKGGEWVGEDHFPLTKDGAKYKGKATTKSFSAFGVAFDLEAPTVSLSLPSGVLSGTVALAAEAADNLEISKVEFYIGSTLIGTDTSAPYSVNYDTSLVSNGDHEFKAVAYDFVSTSSEDSESRSVANEVDSGGPGDDDQTTGGADAGRSMVWLWVVLVLAIIGIGGYMFWKNKQGSA